MNADYLDRRTAWRMLRELNPRAPAWATFKSWCAPNFQRRRPDIAAIMPRVYRQYGAVGSFFRRADIERLARDLTETMHQSTPRAARGADADAHP